MRCPKSISGFLGPPQLEALRAAVRAAAPKRAEVMARRLGTARAKLAAQASSTSSS